jgi:hypothetical protein
LILCQVLTDGTGRISFSEIHISLSA